MKKVLSMLVTALLSLPMLQGAIKVHTIGDSTMAEYDENTTDKRGWGMYLGSFFDPEFVTVNNRGKSGADSRGFYDGTAYWPSVKKQMSEGDYLLIQFAHNDEGTVTYGMDNKEYAAYCAENGLAAPTDARGTNPQTTFREYLRKFIDEARELGVTPILVGPICRKYFSGNDIRRNGRHDLGDKFYKIENGQLLKDQSVPADDHSMDYVYSMSVVAQEKNVPFIDLTQATREMFVEYGETQCTQLLFCNGDNTHTNAMGGNLIARRAAQLLKEAGILAEHITIPTSISANPSSIAIGETYSGVTQNKEFLLTGFGLEPASGTVNLSTNGNLTLSLDKETYSTSANVAYAGSTLFQKVYIRANYSAEGEQKDSVVVVSGDVRLVVPITASVISLSGGSAVKASWALDSKPSAPLAAVCEGPVSGAMTLNHMVASDTKTDATGVDGAATTVVRFHNADDAGTKANWPTEEIDENPIRYIDFSIAAPATMEIRITKIHMEIGAYSTVAMKCHVNTGLGEAMKNIQTIYEAATTALPSIGPKDGNPGAPMNSIDATPMITIPAGDTLHVRILPWHEHTSGSGKYVCVKNVVVEGQAFEPSASNGESGRFGEHGKLTWEYDNGALSIFGNDAMDMWWENGDAPWDHLYGHVTSLDIYPGVTTVAPYAFDDFYKLPSVYLPASITMIGEAAFYSCSAMTSVTLESAVDTIDFYAFAYCNALTSITCKGTIPPRCHPKAFHDVDRSTPLFVPFNSIKAYKEAEVWKEFTNIQADNELQDIQNTSVGSDTAVHKQLRNGQVVIQKGNHTFTIFGQEIAE